MKTAQEFFDNTPLKPEGCIYTMFTEHEIFSNPQIIQLMSEYGEYMFEQGHKEGFEDGKLSLMLQPTGNVSSR